MSWCPGQGGAKTPLSARAQRPLGEGGAGAGPFAASPRPARDAPSPSCSLSRPTAMGIAKLAELIKDEAPEAVRAVPLERYRDNVVALDASVALYQFRTAMPKIVNREGQNISHLQGLFYRTLYLLENGIKPVYVFDGRPPDLKEPVVRQRDF
ncbi:flap endonuclease 1-like [Sphaerodactylus townsendi]|uniref:flap endonuclease 1-like n=1 Tax=Sphaerodactylus townsendi TaxID=933632 RepID=UPI0020263358|nr:flap endonuclease 1-like [Sphaerodactylus townsendi]